MCRACTCDSVRGTSISKLHYTCLQSSNTLPAPASEYVAPTRGNGAHDSRHVRREPGHLMPGPTTRRSSSAEVGGLSGHARRSGSCEDHASGTRPRRQAKFRNNMLTWPKTAPGVTHAAQATVVESRSQHHSAGYCGRKRCLTA